MSRGKLIGHQTVVKWSTNFRTNRTPFATNAAAISLKELEEFILEAKAQCPGFAGLRIYLVRYPLTPQKADQVKSKIGAGGNNLSQPSLVLVPTKSSNVGSAGGEDFKVGTSDEVYALALADPDSPDPDDEFILCPPRC